MSDEDYIRHTPVGTQDKAREAIVVEKEEIDYTPVIDTIEDEVDEELDKSERDSIEELLRKEYDASEVIERWDEWTEPLQPDEADMNATEVQASEDGDLIKATGMAHLQVDTERPELEEMSKVRKSLLDGSARSVLNKSDDENHGDPALDAIWKGTEQARDAVVEAQEEPDLPEENTGPSQFDRETVVQLAATHGIDTGETSKDAGELASDFVKEYFQLSDKDLDKIDVTEIAYKARRRAMTAFVELD